MDIIYALGSGSLWDNNEIRYSLRSVEKHLRNVGNVYIIGANPSFLKDFIHIDFQDKFGEAGIQKANNVKDKILLACEVKKLSNEFLFMADDHFLLQDHDCKTFPYYCHGDLEPVAEAIKKRSPYDNYLKTYRNTIDFLNKSGMPTVDFNPHAPIRYKKKIFKEVMNAAPWDVKWGLLIKSIYCNSTNVSPVEFMGDVKISRPYSYEQIKEIISDKPMFSIGDRGIMNGRTVWQPLLQVMNELYPNPSRWEK